MDDTVWRRLESTMEPRMHGFDIIDNVRVQSNEHARGMAPFLTESEKLGDDIPDDTTDEISRSAHSAAYEVSAVGDPVTVYKPRFLPPPSTIPNLASRRFGDAANLDNTPIGILVPIALCA